ncbi:auxin-responsive protein SAUR76-like [Curcuma longa]|uniref:auxin-responsive protein SAUR76-like n=1 Tax=Curcuma longa TaxID=136217 RepID=UPI003D9E8B9A
MAGKFHRLRSVLKRWNSRSRLAAAADDDRHHSDDDAHAGLHPVYVGKSRRRYLISSRLVDHPLFQVLIGQRSADDDPDAVVVDCEVVLFEHLLWMLENNGDPSPESFDELVEFYAC